MDLKPSDIILAAINVIADPKSHTAHVNARDKRSEVVDPEASTAVKWCWNGAMEKVFYTMTGTTQRSLERQGRILYSRDGRMHRHGWGIPEEFDQYVEARVACNIVAQKHGFNGPIEMNDQNRRTSLRVHRAVLDMMQEAALRLKNEGK